MDEAHQRHLAEILSAFEERAKVKYFIGNVEHGGNLWEKPGVLDMAIDEAIDMVVYLVTLKQQLDGVYTVNEDLKDE